MTTTANSASLQDFVTAGVYVPNASEVITWNLYDHLVYPTAGVQQLNFFATPVGQGVTSALGAVVGSAKTFADTNLQLGNQLPNGQAFLVTSIEIQVEAGASAAANTFTNAPPATFAATATAALVAQINDIDTIRQSGWLEFQVANKLYLQEAPLGRFPASVALNMPGVAVSTSVATSSLVIEKANFGGQPYVLSEPIALTTGFNFNVKLSWPSGVATPSGFNARIGLFLNGALLRVSQ